MEDEDEVEIRFEEYSKKEFNGKGKKSVWKKKNNTQREAVRKLIDFIISFTQRSKIKCSMSIKSYLKGSTLKISQSLSRINSLIVLY